MKKTIIIVTLVLLALNMLAGFMLSSFHPFNLVFTCIVILLTGGLIYFLRLIVIKDAFAISLSLLFVLFGLIAYVLGLLSPARFQDNGFILGAVCLLAVAGIITTICSITSKNK